MKSILSVFLLLLLSASCKKSGDDLAFQSATVVNDCTGYYLRLEGKDFKVCNFESVEDYPDGMDIKAAFINVGGCDKIYGFCSMYHANEGWIRVISVD